MANRAHADDERRQGARALAKWEWEGGASASQNQPLQAPDKLDQQILMRLGCAVIDEWSNLPSHVQRAIFGRATTTVALENGWRLKSEIANFLHVHKDRH